MESINDILAKMKASLNPEIIDYANRLETAINREFDEVLKLTIKQVKEMYGQGD